MSVEEQDSLEPSITAVGHYIFLLLRSLSWRSAKFHSKGEKVLLCGGYYTATPKYEFYFRELQYNIYLTLKTKTLFSTQNKIHIFKPPRNFVFIRVNRNSEKAPDVSFV